VLEGQAILCITSDSVPTAAALNLLNDIHGQVAGELQNGGGRLTLRKPNLPRLLHQNMVRLINIFFSCMLFFSIVKRTQAHFFLK
jgi:hypothetical protein